MLQDVGKDMPDAVVIGARGDHWFLHNPDDPLHTAFVQGFRQRYGRYPVYPSYHLYQAVEPAIMGLTKQTDRFPFAILERMQVYPVEQVDPTLGAKTDDWIQREIGKKK